jgi:hypothetical protein
MNPRGEPPLARLTAVFAIVIAMAACSDTSAGPAPDPAPTPAPAPAPEPAPVPEPEPDPLDDLTPAAAETRRALLAAAETGDWDAIAGLIPEDTLFTSNFSGETDHIAYYRGVERGAERDLNEDLTDELGALLRGPFTQLDDIFVWPALHARVPFEVADGERAALEERYGADLLAQWEAAGSYLGWRVGITEAGAWLFFVAGD